MRSDPLRGFIMILASGVALWKGWQIHHGRTAVLAYALAVLALAMGVWHLVRRSPGRRE